MSPPPTRDPQEALAALERLLSRNVVTLDQAKAAARFITGDPNVVFPPPTAPTVTVESQAPSSADTPPSS